MNLLILKTFFVTLCLCLSSVSEAESAKSRVDLFQKLSDAGIDQVVELPYNVSLIANIGKQVKIHSVMEMQQNRNKLPDATSIREEFSSSFEYYNDRATVPELTYKFGNNDCNYMEAVKVSDTLVCYRRARANGSMLAPVSVYSPRCTTAMTQLSHCYIFAHSVDEVVEALAN